MASDGFDDDDNIEPSAAIERIYQLQTERERKREDINKLEEKLKALNNELAARIEELDRCRKDLDEEQKRNKQAASERREQGNAGSQLQTVQPGSEEEKDRQKEKVRHFIEELLQNRMQPESKPNALGLKTFDERDLMVQQHGKSESDQVVDTVLVTYLKPNSEEKYFLSFRIGKDTTVKNLKDDACLFWGESPVDFILTTADNSKCHDDLSLQKCFRRHDAKRAEPAELFLQKKETKRVVLSASELAEIKEKLPGRTKRRNTHHQDVSHRNGPESLEESMKRLPGLYNYMTQRDRNHLTHLGRIKLRGICVTFVLIILTLISTTHVRPNNSEYFVRSGVEEALSSRFIDPETNASYVDFRRITSFDEVWDWLNNTLPAQVFVNTSEIRRSNYVPGYLQVRMQQVAPQSSDNCEHAPELPPDTVCYGWKYNSDTQGTDDFDGIKLYWEGGIDNGTNITGVVGTGGRHGAPWSFRSDDEVSKTNIDREAGFFQSYDASGYVAQYEVQYKGTTPTEGLEAYQADMTYFRSQDWISGRTRSLHVNLDLYNGNRDYWLSAWYLVEFPAVGIIRPSTQVLIYRSLVSQTGMSWFGLTQFFIDLARLACIVYFSILNPYWEIKWEHQRKKSFTEYLFHAMGVTDAYCGVMFIVIFIIRYFVVGMWGQDHNEEWKNMSNEFWSLRDTALLWRTHTVLEGFLLMGLLFRLCTYMRINRHFYVLWETLREAGKTGWLFVIMFVPIFFGFVTLTNALLGPYSNTHASFHQTTTAILIDLQHGPTPPDRDQEVFSWSEKYALSLALCFQFMTTLIFLNAWIALMLSEYQRCRVMYGYNPKHYRWAEYQYVYWCLWRPFQKIYMRFIRRGRVKLPIDDTLNDDDSLL